MGSKEDDTKHRWVFGDYIVYCSDAHSARRIYEEAYNRANRTERFGSIELADGLTGRWVVMESKEKAPKPRAPR